MTASFESLERTITAALGRGARGVTSAGAGRWRFTLGTGPPVPALGTLEPGWLVLQAPLGDLAGRSAWDLLRAGGGLPGPVKVALPVGGGAPVLQADLPLDGAADPAARMVAACAGLEEGMARIGGKRRPPATRRCRPEARPDLRPLLQEANWPFTEQDRGTLVVDLDVRRGAYRARLDADATAVRVSADLARTRTLTRESREAIGRLLLEASGRLRLARAAARETTRGVSLHLEAVLPGTPAPPEIDHALAALTVGCGTYGLEVEALLDEVVAAQYLLVRGAAPLRRTDVDAARAS